MYILKKSIFNNLTSLLIVLFGISLIAISFGVYTQATKYTLQDYDQKLVADRNGVVEKVDVITNLLGSEKEKAQIETKIGELEALITSFEQKLEQEEVPKNGEPLKQENKQFANLAKKVAQTSKEYLALFEDDQLDVNATISKYNASVDALNTQITKIDEEVKN